MNIGYKINQKKEIFAESHDITNLDPMREILTHLHLLDADEPPSSKETYI